MYQPSFWLLVPAMLMALTDQACLLSFDFLRWPSWGTADSIISRGAAAGTLPSACFSWEEGAQVSLPAIAALEGEAKLISFGGSAGVCRPDRACLGDFLDFFLPLMGELCVSRLVSAEIGALKGLPSAAALILR